MPAYDNIVGVFFLNWYYQSMDKDMEVLWIYVDVDDSDSFPNKTDIQPPTLAAYIPTNLIGQRLFVLLHNL